MRSHPAGAGEGTGIGSQSGVRAIARVPEAIWGPMAVGAELLAVGLFGLAAGQPWLFPSLGPTAFLHAERPEHASARPYNTIAGHLTGLAAGVAAVLTLGAAGAPAVLSTKELVPIRVAAAVLAAAMTMLGLAVLRASHPPAAATTLLVALGGFEPSWPTAGTILAGVVITAGLGEAVRFLRTRIFPRPSD